MVCGGCATTTDHHGYQTKRYFGWLVVTEHQSTSTPGPRVERVKALGVRFDRGVGIGYFDDAAVSLPKECHLIILAKDVRQLDEFLQAYPQLSKQEMKPCVKPIDL